MNERYTIIVPDLARETAAAVAVIGWRHTGEAIEQTTLWLPRSQVQIERLPHQVRITAPAWLLLSRDIHGENNPTGAWQVCKVGAVTAPPQVVDFPIIHGLDPVVFARPRGAYTGRHPDEIEGDLHGALEQLAEGRPGVSTRVARLSQEYDRALDAGPAAYQALFYDAGWQEAFDFEGVQCMYDGELEIAAEEWHVDPNDPQAWRLIEQAMIDAHDPRVVEPVEGWDAYRRREQRPQGLRLSTGGRIGARVG